MQLTDKLEFDEGVRVYEKDYSNGTCSHLLLRVGRMFTKK